jgi:DNA topoisomerase-1
VPDDLPPDELTVEGARAARGAASDEPIGELDGPAGVRQERPLRPVRAVGHGRRAPPGLEKPKMASLFKTMALEHHHVDQARQES